LEHPTVPVMSFPWTYWIPPTLAVVTWVAAWWCSRRFRLWFAVLAPVAAIGGILLGLALTLAEGPDAASTCMGSSCDTDAALSCMGSGCDTADLIGIGSILALLVVVPLTVVTLIVEYVLLVRRQNREAAVHQAEKKASGLRQSPEVTNKTTG
jgi:hypothetical protein